VFLLEVNIVRRKTGTSQLKRLILKSYKALRVSQVFLDLKVNRVCLGHQVYREYQVHMVLKGWQVLTEFLVLEAW